MIDVYQDAPSQIEVPPEIDVVKRLNGFATDIGLECTIVVGGGMPDLLVTVPGIAHTALRYITTDLVGHRDVAWRRRYATDAEVRHRWDQGLARTALGDVPDGKIIVPDNSALNRVFYRGGDLLIANTIEKKKSPKETDSGLAYFELADPFNHRLLVIAGLREASE